MVRKISEEKQQECRDAWKKANPDRTAKQFHEQQRKCAKGILPEGLADLQCIINNQPKPQSQCTPENISCVGKDGWMTSGYECQPCVKKGKRLSPYQCCQTTELDKLKKEGESMIVGDTSKRIIERNCAHLKKKTTAKSKIIMNEPSVYATSYESSNEPEIENISSKTQHHAEMEETEPSLEVLEALEEAEKKQKMIYTEKTEPSIIYNKTEECDKLEQTRKHLKTYKDEKIHRNVEKRLVISLINKIDEQRKDLGCK